MRRKNISMLRCHFFNRPRAFRRPAAPVNSAFAKKHNIIDKMSFCARERRSWTWLKSTKENGAHASRLGINKERRDRRMFFCLFARLAAPEP